jgi:tRNA pseudouridine55 synthase
VSRKPDADVPPSLLLVDKPAGMTSHDVVAVARRVLSVRKVGHAGTLDPMATGLLVLGVGAATRLLGHLSGSDKTYDATVRLGQSTVTDDAEGEVTGTTSAAGVGEDAVREALAAQVGALQQVPSSVSAVKVDGRRSYDRVRAGEEFELAARSVIVHRIDVHRIARPAPDLVDVDVTVACSTGTYIRAIARDVGAALGVGGHLTALRRTAVGAFTLAEAATLDELADREDPVTMPLPAAADRCFPRRDADEVEAKTLSHGGSLAPIGVAEPYAVFAPDGTVLAIVREKDGRARPEIVLVP